MEDLILVSESKKDINHWNLIDQLVIQKRSVIYWKINSHSTLPKGTEEIGTIHCVAKAAQGTVTNNNAPVCDLYTKLTW